MMRALSKGRLETPRKSALARFASGRDPVDAGPPPTAEELRDLVRADVREAETVGRARVHSILAEAGPAAPTAVAGRIYREVLHCDLDDPMLGLGPVLAGEEPLERALGK